MEAIPGLWMGIAALMLIPIVMIVLTLTVPYKRAYDSFLITVSFAFNAVMIWYVSAWPG